MVTLTKTDLIQPIGELDAAFFPEGNMDAYVAGWLDQASTIIDANPEIEHPDAAAEAYVYSRAFRYLATLWNTLATTTTIAGQITRTINKEQVQFFVTEADRWLVSYVLLNPPIEVEVTPSQAVGASYQTSIRAVW